MERRATGIAVRGKSQGLSQELLRSNEHLRTPMNTETLIVDLWRKDRRLTDVNRAAEWRRDSRVQSG